MRSCPGSALSLPVRLDVPRESPGENSVIQRGRAWAAGALPTTMALGVTAVTHTFPGPTTPTPPPAGGEPAAADRAGRRHARDQQAARYAAPDADRPQRHLGSGRHAHLRSSTHRTTPSSRRSKLGRPACRPPGVAAATVSSLDEGISMSKAPRPLMDPERLPSAIPGAPDPGVDNDLKWSAGARPSGRSHGIHRRRPTVRRHRRRATGGEFSVMMKFVRARLFNSTR